jgi:hypothetical protein
MSNTDISLKPFAVPLRTEGKRLLGNKSVSEIYDQASKGRLELVKDGRKTLITLRSIDAYTAGWQPAKIKQYVRDKSKAGSG